MVYLFLEPWLGGFTCHIKFRLVRLRDCRRKFLICFFLECASWSGSDEYVEVFKFLDRVSEPALAHFLFLVPPGLATSNYVFVTFLSSKR